MTRTPRRTLVLRVAPILALLAAASPLRTAQAQLPCCPQPAGMTNWYKFDAASPLTDQTSGNTLTGTPTITTGKVKQGDQFKGTLASVLTASNPNQPTFTQDFSFDAWIMIPPNSPTKGVETLVEKRESQPKLQGWSFFLDNGRLGVQIAAAGAYHNYSSASMPAIPTGAWHFVAAVVRRSGVPPAGGQRVEFYLDGVLKGTANIVAPELTANVNTTTAMKIGSTTIPKFGSFFTGALDEVELFQAALAPSDIAAIFKADSSGKCVGPCPQLKIDFQSKTTGSVVNASLLLTNGGPANASNVTVTAITCTNGYVYAPQNGLLNIPFVIPGAANLALNGTTGFNLFFTKPGAVPNGAFACTVTWTAGNGCKQTQVVNIPQ